MGGNFGLQLGNTTNIELSPLVGYKITDQFSAGIGLTYIYFKKKIDNNQDFVTNIYGYRTFLRYDIMRQFYALTEYESLSIEQYTHMKTNDRIWVNGLMVGGGYFVPLSTNLIFNISCLYNLLYNKDTSPYNSPWVIRMGVNLGL